MSTLRPIHFLIRQLRVPRKSSAVLRRHFRITRVLRRGEGFYVMPSVLNNHEVPSSPTHTATEPVVMPSNTISDKIFHEVARNISAGEYETIVPMLSNYKKQKKLLSNPHLLSIISLLLNVENGNLMGIAYEVFLLYISEVAVDIRGFPSDLLEMLLRVVHYYDDQTNFDLLFSQYLNSPILKESILKKALVLYIGRSNIELAKQLLYQVVTYYVQNGLDVSPSILELFLQKLIRHDARFSNMEFGYNIWIQAGLPTTWVINDLMLEGLIANGDSNKLSNFIIKLAKEDPKILAFNEFLGKSSHLQDEELIEYLKKIIPLFTDGKNYFYLKLVEKVPNTAFLTKDVYKLIMADVDRPANILLRLSQKIGISSGPEELYDFLRHKVIETPYFNQKFMKVLSESYMHSYPDYGHKIKIIFQQFLSEHFNTKTAFWFPKESRLRLYRYKRDYKLISPTDSAVMKTLKQIRRLEIPVSEKAEAVFNALSRSGLRSEPTVHEFFLKMYEDPSFKEPQDLKFVEKLLLRTSPEDLLVSTEFAIVKKGIALAFSDSSLNRLDRLKAQKDALLKFLVQNSEKLDKKALTALCDTYINLKEFDISKKILDQVRSLLDNERHIGSSFEQRNYDNLLVKRLEFKQEMLSHNYAKVIELVLSLKMDKTLVLRKFFLHALSRDLKYLHKYNTRLQSLSRESAIEYDVKEAQVVEKLCIYLSKFIDELFLRYEEEKGEVISKLSKKLTDLKDYCK